MDLLPSNQLIEELNQISVFGFSFFYEKKT